MDILDHHRQTIQRLIDEYQNDARFPALIIGGSVAKGCARPDSDVDGPGKCIFTGKESPTRVLWAKSY